MSCQSYMQLDAARRQSVAEWAVGYWSSMNREAHDKGERSDIGNSVHSLAEIIADMDDFCLANVKAGNTEPVYIVIELLYGLRKYNESGGKRS